MGEPLALNGGGRVRATMLPYGRQSIDDEDVAAVVAALKSDWITTGPRVDEFERAIATRVGARYGVACSSGTSALHLAVVAGGIGPGDEVIIPALTFAASANAVLYAGGTPVFADVRADTLNVDTADVASKIGARTRAIITVDFAGQPSDLTALRALAAAHRLVLVEDAAHALGATVADRAVGSLADLTVFSFHPVKHITTGEGGMVTTDDEDAARRMARFRNHGITSNAASRLRAGEWQYDMVELGFNYRLTDVQCALGLAQLRKLDRLLDRREAIAARYRAAFADLAGLKLPEVAPGVRHAWHLFPVLLDLDRLDADRRLVFKALRAEGIGVNVHYVPVYWHPFYQAKGYVRGACPRTEAAYERLLSLPLFPAMVDRDVEDVIDAVVKVVGHFVR